MVLGGEFRAGGWKSKSPFHPPLSGGGGGVHVGYTYIGFDEDKPSNNLSNSYAFSLAVKTHLN